MRSSLTVALCVASCASPTEPRDVPSVDRQEVRDAPGSDVRDELEPVFFDAADVPAIDATEFDAPSIDTPNLDVPSLPADRPAPGIDVRDTGPADVIPDVVCPPDGFGGYQWRLCGHLCCPRDGCLFDVFGRAFCQ